AAENVAVAVHVGRLRHGPDDRVARPFGHLSLPDVVAFPRFYYHIDRSAAINDPSRGRGNDKKQPWRRTATCSKGRAASVPQRPRITPTQLAISRCWKGWNPSASAPACTLAAPTSGPCTISWPK